MSLEPINIAQSLALVDEQEMNPGDAIGIFGVQYRDNGGEWKVHHADKNLIVNGARKVMAHLLGDTSTSLYIQSLKLGGDNAATSGVMLSPASPQLTDTANVYSANLFTRGRGDLILGSPAFVVSYPSTPNETSVLFSVTIAGTEGNIMDPTATVYLCAGLYTVSSVLFASKSFPAILKTVGRELLITWELRF